MGMGKPLNEAGILRDSQPSRGEDREDGCDTPSISTLPIIIGENEREMAFFLSIAGCAAIYRSWICVAPDN